MENYGEAIKKLRKYREYTQRELAEKLGVSNQVVSKWENNVTQPDIGMLRAICALFEIGVDDFIRIANGTRVEEILHAVTAVEREVAPVAETPVPETPAREETAEKQNAPSEREENDQTPVSTEKRAKTKGKKWIAWVVAVAVLTVTVLGAALGFGLVNATKEQENSASTSSSADGSSEKEESELPAAIAVTYYSDGEVYDTEKVQKGGLLVGVTPTKKGYTFEGWHVDEACSQKFDLEQEVYKEWALYAKWTANTYTLRFDGGGGSGSMSDVSATYDRSVTLPDCTFTRDGYTFSYWAVGSQKYGDGAHLVNLTDQAGQVMVLTAVWEKL